MYEAEKIYEEKNATRSVKFSRMVSTGIPKEMTSKHMVFKETHVFCVLQKLCSVDRLFRKGPFISSSFKRLVRPPDSVLCSALMYLIFFVCLSELHFR